MYGEAGRYTDDALAFTRAIEKAVEPIEPIFKEYLKNDYFNERKY